jgi:hypothetical protein
MENFARPRPWPEGFDQRQQRPVADGSPQKKVTFLKKKSVWHPTDDPIDACVLLMVSEAIHLGEKEINTRGW